MNDPLITPTEKEEDSEQEGSILSNTSLLERPSLGITSTEVRTALENVLAELVGRIEERAISIISSEESGSVGMKRKRRWCKESGHNTEEIGTAAEKEEEEEGDGQPRLNSISIPRMRQRTRTFSSFALVDKLRLETEEVSSSSPGSSREGEDHEDEDGKGCSTKLYTFACPITYFYLIIQRLTQHYFPFTLLACADLPHILFIDLRMPLLFVSLLELLEAEREVKQALSPEQSRMVLIEEQEMSKMTSTVQVLRVMRR